MGELKIRIPDKVETVFRRLAMQRFGYAKGSISAAAGKAIEDWTKAQAEIKPMVDPVEAISGLLKHVKKTSVELQHEVGKIVSEKYANRR